MRPATRDDVDGCLDVMEEVVNEGIWLGAQPPLDRDERRERLIAHIGGERSLLLAAVEEGDAGPTVVGELALDVAPYGVAQFWMCVAPRRRGQGVGGALVEAAIESAVRLGAHKLSLQVWPHNVAARRLYRRYGFEEEGRLRRHYPRHNGELWDAIVMGLVLDQERPGSPLAKEPEPQETTGD